MMKAAALRSSLGIHPAEDDSLAPFEPRRLRAPVDRIRDRGAIFLTEAAAA